MLIDDEDGSMSISHQCELLSVCRSSYYYEPVPESPLNLRLMRLLDRIHLVHPYAGSRMLTGILGRRGYEVNRKRIHFPDLNETTEGLFLCAQSHA